MRYVDTSVLIAYLTPERDSHLAQAFMRSPGDALAISSWTEVELMSGLGLKLRTNQLSEAAAHSVVDVYRRLVSPQLRHISVNDSHHRRASTLLEGWMTSLRAADGLHLSIALANNATVCTLDKAMANAGPSVGVRVNLLSQP